MTETPHNHREGDPQQRPQSNFDGIQLMVVIPLAFQSPILSSQLQHESVKANKFTPKPRSANVKAPFLGMAEAEKVAAKQLAQLKRGRPRRRSIGEKGLPDFKQFDHKQSMTWSDSHQSLSTTDRQPSDAGSNASPARREQVFNRQRYAHEYTQTLDTDVEEGMMPRFRSVAEFY